MKAGRGAPRGSKWKRLTKNPNVGDLAIMSKKEKKIRERVEGTLYRDGEVRADGIVDAEARIVDISFSSEIPYLRSSYFSEPWYEVLGHKRGEMDMTRLSEGGTLHYNHNRTREDRIGAVLKVSIKEHRGHARVQFSADSRVDDVWNDVRDGLLSNVSVAYKINEKVLVREGGEGEPDTYRVTAWEPVELSFVDIPADSSVGMGRGDGNTDDYVVVRLDEPMEESDMTEAERKAAVAAAAKEAARKAADELSDAPEDAEVAERRRLELAAERAAGVKAEQDRHTAIRAAVVPLKKLLGEGYQKLLDESLADSECSVEKVRELVQVQLGAGIEPVDPALPKDPRDEARISEAMMDSLIMRCYPVIPTTVAERKEQAERPGRDFVGFTLTELARFVLQKGGVDTLRMPKDALVGRAFGTSNFQQILEGVANKSMLKGFDEAEETWQTWAQLGNLTDFKAAKRVGLSTFDNLVLVREGEEYKYGHYEEEGEQISLATYGKLFSITRQAIINDDLNMFMRIPSGMGRAASRVVGDIAYGVLVSNPNMQDGKPLFDAAHKNIAANGDVPNVATITAGAIQMRKQKDVSESATGLNIRPVFLICPVALELAAKIIMQAQYDPDGKQNNVPNTVQGSLTVVSDIRLDEASALTWYLAAGKQLDTIELAFLDGQVQPMMEEKVGWTVDGVTYKVRQDVGAAPLSHRTWVRNPGE